MVGREAAREDLAEPLTRLYEKPGLPQWNLPPKLTELYGGSVGFPTPCVFANFVASLDGVVALGPEFPSSGALISARQPADRFIMALLRACADAVLVGAGTLRASLRGASRYPWTPEEVYPAAAGSFAALRHRLRLSHAPEVVVVTASGNLPTHHPALTVGAVVAATTTAAQRLDGQLPPTCTLLALGDGPVLRMPDVLDAIQARGHSTVLTEAGPSVFGQLAREHLVDELFLTLSPVLAGRAQTPRAGLISGLELLPGPHKPAEILSLRQHASYLFLHYRLPTP